MSIIFSGNGSIVTNGVVPIQQGGTGNTTKETAINALLPSQTDNANKILSTDGQNVKWIVNTGGTGTGTGGSGIPSQEEAFAGYFLSTDGTIAYWTPIVAAGIQAGGGDGQLQYNSNGVLTATAGISYNDLDVLTFGTGQSDTFKIEGAIAYNVTYTGTTVVIKGGDSFPNPNPTPTPPAGDIVLIGGGGFGNAQAGSIIFKVGQIPAEKFRITDSGAWSLDGAIGDIDTLPFSRGVMGAPVWKKLPIASDSVFGVIKVLGASDSGLTIDDENTENGTVGALRTVVRAVDGTTIKNNNGTIRVDIYEALPEIDGTPDTGNVGKFLKATDVNSLEWVMPTATEVLPTQTDKDGLFLYTNGTSANWASPFPKQKNENDEFLTDYYLKTKDGVVSWTPIPTNIATTTQTGAVMVDGTTIKITENGLISVNKDNILPPKTDNKNKVLKVVEDTDPDKTLILQWSDLPAPYVLPKAGIGGPGILGGVVIDGESIVYETDNSGAVTNIIKVEAAGTGKDGVLGGVRLDGTTITANTDKVISANYSLSSVLDDSKIKLKLFGGDATHTSTVTLKAGSNVTISKLTDQPNNEDVIEISSTGGGGGGGTGSVTSIGIVGVDTEISGDVSDFNINNSPVTGSGNILLKLKTVTVSKGGTGLTSISKGSLLVGNTTSTGYTAISSGPDGTVLLAGSGSGVDQTLPQYGKVRIAPERNLSGVITTSSHVTGTLEASNGGTGFGEYNIGDMLYASSTDTLSKLSLPQTKGWVLSYNGASTTPSWQKIALSKIENDSTVVSQVFGILPASNGGTGIEIPTKNSIMVGDYINATNSSVWSTIESGASGTALLAGNGAGSSQQKPYYGKISLNTVVNESTGQILTPQHVTGVLPVANGGTGSSDAETVRTTLGLAKSGANSDITSLTNLSTPLSVPQGGTGVTAIPKGSLLVGDTTVIDGNTTYKYSPINVPNSSGNVLLSDGRDDSGNPTLPYWGKVRIAPERNLQGQIITPSHITGTLDVGSGGTGLTTIAKGSLLVGTADSNGLSTMTTIASAAEGNVLLSGTGSGTTQALPDFGKVRIAPIRDQNGNITQPSHISGVLEISSGGTGANNKTDAVNNLIGYTPVNKAGDSMTGALTLIGNPTEALHAAPKQYVDNLASGLKVRQSVRTATLSEITATYSNGTNGVGATLTGTGSIPTIGGITPVVGNRILVKNQTVKSQNGVYTVTQLNPFILTRATDYDSTAEVIIGDAFFVTEGTLISTTWVLATPGTIVIGTTDIEFSQFSAPGSYGAGPGISITNNTINNTGVISVSSKFTNITTSTDAQTPGVTYLDWSGELPVGMGGTGATLPETARTNLGAAASGANNDITKLSGLTTALSASQGGTGLSSISKGDLLVGNTSSTGYTAISSGADGTVLLAGSGSGVDQTLPQYGKVRLSPVLNLEGQIIQPSHVTGIIDSSNGGTGFSAYKVGDLLYANTTASLAKLEAVGKGNVLLSNGQNTSPTYGKVRLSSLKVLGNVSEDSHITGTLEVGNGGTGLSSISKGNLLVGNTTSDGYTTISSAAEGNVLLSGTGTGTNQSLPSFGKVRIAPTRDQNENIITPSHIIGTLEVSNGGTGVNSIAANGVLVGNEFGTGITSVNYTGTNGEYMVLIQGADADAPSFGKIPLTAGEKSLVTGTLGVSNGGTGLGTGSSAYKRGDLIYSDNDNSLARLSIPTVTPPSTSDNKVLTIDSGLPTWKDPLITTIEIPKNNGFSGSATILNGIASISIQTSVFETNDSDTLQLVATNKSGSIIKAGAPLSLTTTNSVGVATFNSATGVLNIPDYSKGGLVPANTTTLGGVIVGDGLDVVTAEGANQGKISVKPANNTVIGGIKVGTGLTVVTTDTVDKGTVSVTPATGTVLGGIKVGTGLNVVTSGADEGKLNVNITSLLPDQVDHGTEVLTTDGAGTLSWAPPTIPKATDTSMGGFILDPDSMTMLDSGKLQTNTLILPSSKNKQVLFNDNGKSSGASNLLYDSNLIRVGTPRDSTFSINSITDLDIATLSRNNVSVKSETFVVKTSDVAQYTVLFPCRTVTSANIPGTYNNGAAGDGASLTVTASNITLAAIGGVNLEFTDRVLFKSQSDAKQNGIYSLTSQPNSTTWVFVRTDDFDNPGAASQNCLLTIFDGTFSGTQWKYIGKPTVFGTDDISWVQHTSQYTQRFKVLNSGAWTLGTTNTNTGTAGQPLLSTGDSSSPTWGILSIEAGGTGKTSFNAGYMVSVINEDMSNELKTIDTIPGTDIDGDIPGKASGLTATLEIAKGGTGKTEFAVGYLKSIQNEDTTKEIISSATINAADVSGDIPGKATGIHGTGVISIENGGTNASDKVTALTNLLPSQAEQNGKVLTSNGTAAYWATFLPSGLLPTATTQVLGAVKIDGTSIAFNEDGQIIATGAGFGTVTNIKLSPGLTGLKFNGSTDQITITSTADITLGGVLGVAYGGTGAETFSAGYLKANGTSAFTTVEKILGSDVSGDIDGNAKNVTGTVAIDNGGTNATTRVAANNNIVSWGNQLTVNNLPTNYNLNKLWGFTPINGTTNGPITVGIAHQLLLPRSEESDTATSWSATQLSIPVPTNQLTPGNVPIYFRFKNGGTQNSGWGAWVGLHASTATTITDTLSVEKGGTGKTKRDEALNALLPVQQDTPEKTTKGRFLISDGKDASWMEMNSIPINGNNGEMLYNWNGAVTPATKMVFDNVNTLTLGTISGVNTQDLFYFTTPPGAVVEGTVRAPFGISIKPGSQPSANGEPGNVYISGSTATGPASAGGTVFIDAGTSNFAPGGNIVFRTASGPGTALENRLAIVDGGAWNINGKTGTLGQVLVSSGPSAPPEWRASPATAEGLLGTTIASTVTNSSLTTVGTLESLVVSGTVGVGTATPKAKLAVSLGNTNIGVEIVPSATSVIRSINRGNDTFTPLEISSSSITLRTGATAATLEDRLSISQTGVWKINNDAGLDGQMLVSKGPDSPPQWKTSTAVETIGNESGLTFTKTDNALAVGGTLKVENGGTGATTGIAASQNVANFGNLRSFSAITDFNLVRDWGATFVKGNTSGPTAENVTNSLNQSYQLMLALGSEFSDWAGSNIFAAQIAIPRATDNPTMSIRFKEGGNATANWSAWQKISAGQADTLTKTLTLDKGGTGATNQIDALNNLLPPKIINDVSVDNKFLKWNATDNKAVWDSMNVDSSNINGQVPFENGGTTGTNRQDGLNKLSGIEGSAVNTVLRFNGTDVSLSKVNISKSITNALGVKQDGDVIGILDVSNGGTGASNKADALRNLLPNQGDTTQLNTQGKFLQSNGLDAQWASALAGIDIKFNSWGLNTTVTTTTSGVVTISPKDGDAGALSPKYGGTGTNFLKGFVIGNGNDGSGNPKAFTAISKIDIGVIADADKLITGALPIVNGGTGKTNAVDALIALLPAFGGAVGSDTEKNNNKFLTNNGTNVTWGTPTVDISKITGTLGETNGGTGATTFAGARKNILPKQESAVNNGYYLVTTGSAGQEDAVWQKLSVTSADINVTTTGGVTSGHILANKGGTGFFSYTIGDILYANSTTTLAKLSIPSVTSPATPAGRVLTLTASGSSFIPAWSAPPTTSPGGTSTNFGEIQFRGRDGTFAGSTDFVIDTTTPAAANTGVVSFAKIPKIGSGATALEIGYLGLPRVTTFDASAKGKRIAVTAGVTIPANTYAAGDAFSFYNDSAATVTFTQGSGLTLRKDGTTSTGNFTLAARGTAFLWFNSATEAILSGSIT